MLCFNPTGYTRACGGVTGGVSDVAIFDPADFDFTQAADVDGVKQPYSAVALRDGATAADGAKMYVINFQDEEAEKTTNQAVTGCTVTYTHEWILSLPDNSQGLTTFLESIDAGGCCCGIGIAYRMNSGKIFIAGEKYVNGSAIPKFRIKQDGSDGTTGKLMSDENVYNLHLKGTYSRNLYEYSGTWDSIVALM